MEKYNKISSKMYKQLVQQKVQQKVQKKVQQKVEQKVYFNCVALLMRWFVLTKLVKPLYLNSLNSLNTQLGM